MSVPENTDAAVDLPRLSRPMGAVAGALQLMCAVDARAPRHSGVELTTMQRFVAPAAGAASYFTQLYDGFLAAHAPLRARGRARRRDRDGRGASRR